MKSIWQRSPDRSAWFWVVYVYGFLSFLAGCLAPVVSGASYVRWTSSEIVAYYFTAIASIFCLLQAPGFRVAVLRKLCVLAGAAWCSLSVGVLVTGDVEAALKVPLALCAVAGVLSVLELLDKFVLTKPKAAAPPQTSDNTCRNSAPPSANPSN